MSLVKIRAALETALNAMSPALSTAWENSEFVPVDGTAYQQVSLDPEQPDDLELGCTHYEQRGIMNINLRYPIQTGSAAATTRAEAIKTAFKRGTTFINNGQTVVSYKTPHIGQGAIVENRYFLPVRIFFKTFIVQ